jgi:hypothetical protein
MGISEAVRILSDGARNKGFELLATVAQIRFSQGPKPDSIVSPGLSPWGRPFWSRDLHCTVRPSGYITGGLFGGGYQTKTCG